MSGKSPRPEGDLVSLQTNGSGFALSWLLALLAMSEAAYIALIRINAINGVLPVLTFVGLLGVLFGLYVLAFMAVKRMGAKRGMLLAIAAGAILFRVTMMLAGLPHDASVHKLTVAVYDDVRGTKVTFERDLLYDDDIWRYLWDGHLWAHGVNPYRFAVNDERVDSLAVTEGPLQADAGRGWADIRDNVNHASLPTIYPPLAQIIFRFSHWAAPGSVLAMKAIFISFDLATALLVALTLAKLGQPPAWVILYAWNPMVIKTVAASGHVDVVVAAMLAATAYLLLRGARTLSAFSFAFAVLAKISPLVLVPFIVKRIGWLRAMLALGTVFVFYLPFLDAGTGIFTSLLKFAREWQFNSGFFLLMKTLAGLLYLDAGLVARAAGAAALAAYLGWLFVRDDGEAKTFPKTAAIAMSAVILLSATVMPWYLMWFLPLAVVAHSRTLLWFSGLVNLGFLVMIDGTERPWALLMEYTLLIAVWIYDAKRGARALTSEEGLAGSSGPRTPQQHPGPFIPAAANATAIGTSIQNLQTQGD